MRAFRIARHVLVGFALLTSCLVLVILLTPLVALLSVFLYIVGWFVSVLLTVILFVLMLWTAGFLLRKIRQAASADCRSVVP